MAKIVNATLNAEEVSALDFQLVLGTDPGVGSVTLPGGGYLFPFQATLMLTDNETTLNLYNICITSVRQVETPNGGIDTVCSIADRRYTWKHGYINGIYNEEDYKGIPKREKTLSQLLDLLFAKLAEVNYVYFGVPTVYPEVVWEYTNPGEALNDLCERYQLTVGYDTNGNIVVCPLNYARTIPTLDKMHDELADTNFFLPESIILVGEREIRQITFEDLIPVGEDTDGSIVPINDLSYAPTGAGQGGESYAYELWGEEIRMCFANLASDAVKELAEKSVFKWYQIDFTKYPKEQVLPLLNEISDTETVEGITDHAKPYVIGEKTEWQNNQFITLARAKITDGYQIDKKLGIVQFNEPQVKSISSNDINSGGFTLGDFDMVAAYERYEGTDDDFITFESLITGGVLAPAVHKENSIVGWYKQTSALGTAFESLEFELLNATDINQYASEVLVQLHSQYIELFPRVVKYPGLYAMGAYGALRQVQFNLDATSGVETTLQYGIEIPKLHIDNYEEKLNKKLMKTGVREVTKGRKKDRRQQSRGAGKRQKRPDLTPTQKHRLSIFAKYSKDARLAKNTTAEDIPLNGFVDVYAYDSTNRVVSVKKWDGTGKFKAIAPEGIKAGKMGPVLMDGAGAVKKASGETIVVGDTVTCVTDDYTAKKDDAGDYTVTKVDGDKIYVEKLGGGSAPAEKQVAIVTQIPEYNNAAKAKFIVQKAALNGSSEWVGDGTDIDITRALSYEGFAAFEGTDDAKDIRNWFPWPAVGSLVYIIERYDELAADYIWYIDMVMSYGGKAADSCIRVNDETLLVQVVWQ